MERAGHVERKRDLGDRRAVRLELTASGRRLVAAMSGTLRQHIKEVLHGLNSATRKNLRQDLGELEQSIRAIGAPSQ